MAENGKSGTGGDQLTWVLPDAQTGSDLQAQAMARACEAFDRGEFRRVTSDSAYIVYRNTADGPRFHQIAADEVALEQLHLEVTDVVLSIRDIKRESSRRASRW